MEHVIRGKTKRKRETKIGKKLFEQEKGENELQSGKNEKDKDEREEGEGMTNVR